MGALVPMGSRAIEVLGEGKGGLSSMLKRLIAKSPELLQNPKVAALLAGGAAGGLAGHMAGKDEGSDEEEALEALHGEEEPEMSALRKKRGM